MAQFPEKIRIMKEGGAMLTSAMKKVLSKVKVGATGLELEAEFDKLVTSYNVVSAFKDYEGYPYHLCVGVNNMVVHGFPSDLPFEEGDVVTVDMGFIHKGYYTDMARTVVVGKDINGYQPFIDSIEKAFWASIANAKSGGKVGDMSAASQKIVEGDNNYSVVREMVGHGVGEKLHMMPNIPGYGKPNSGPKLKEFQTLAVEIIAIRDPDPTIYMSEDEWQTFSASGEVCAIYENSIYVGKNGGVLLTGRKD